MLGVAVIFGGGRAIGGIPALAGAILPSSVVAAQASDAPQFVGVRLRVGFDEFGPSKFPPQVLYPVVYHSFPEWLSQHEARDIASATELPAVRPGTTASVAIVIDDLGPDITHTDRAVALPTAITL